MLFIRKKALNRLAEPYREPGMLMCYATPQHLHTYSTRALLLVNQEKLVVLFLNLFSTRVVHQSELAIADLQEQKFKSGVGLGAVWSFKVNGSSWRFQIMWTILTLGSMQRDFLTFVETHIID
ncbi:hypothetical protein [Paenibacillus wenxiniae]|uniref:YokE-like PH domain-containing protein n=1 Tax=Paenibacillus wenxiniae TaxID=1636843 RepID=A0ABW4RGS7_9BACL